MKTGWNQSLIFIAIVPTLEFKKVLKYEYLVLKKKNIQIAEFLLCFSSLHRHQMGIWFFLPSCPKTVPDFVAQLHTHHSIFWACLSGLCPFS